VLVVDDDPKIVSLVRLYLEHAGFDVTAAYNGTQALEETARERPDLVVLDVMLPRLGGVEVCRRLRAQGPVPVIMLTARAGEDDTLAGLEAGADDYVTKPFSPRELVARVRTVLRRAPAPSANDGAGETIVRGRLTVDLAAREARASGRAVPLTPREFALLETFARAPGRAFTRAELLDRAFGDDPALERTVDVHVKNLRRKLGRAVRIETVFGVGYRLAADD
jgi:DNA-binding response OmpR family regulator